MHGRTTFPLRALTAGAVALALAAPAAADAAEQRRGGKVTAAWPAKPAGKPKGALAQWLASQVGPVKAPPKTKATKAVRRGARAAAATKKAPEPLRLVRSYDVPAGAPEKAALQNLSWTYDNALAAKAFITAGARTQAEQLLDQLMALQRTDGGLEYSWDVYQGTTKVPARTGSVAWVAIAAAAYREVYGNSRYDKLLGGALGYLLAQKRADGLLDGGDGAEAWASTQHNLLALWALTETWAQVATSKGKGGGNVLPSTEELEAAIVAIGNAVHGQLYVADADGTAHFRQGIGDEQRPLDAQALGVLFELSRGNVDAAKKVAAGLQKHYTLTGRSVLGAGPFTGFRPYADAGSPDVLWMEGTAQAQLALATVGTTVPGLAASITKWAGVTAKDGAGPLGADKDVVDARFSAYHAWPTSAAGSWLLIGGTKPSEVAWPKLFVASDS